MAHKCSTCSEYPGLMTCPRCGGDGKMSSGETCYYCQGKGKVTCPACNGTGKIED